MFFLTKSPYILKKFYPKQLIWHKSRAEKVIYLTFDDGPVPIVTPWVIKTLKNYNSKATFFCIGDNIVKHPEIFEQLKTDGHAIGNHTFNHLKGWKTDDDIYLSNFLKCQELTQTDLFRPPYGRIKKSQIKKVSNEYQIANRKNQNDSQTSLPNYPQLNIIMWDVLSGDFDPSLSPEKCLHNVLKHTENGSVVVFHDSLKAWDRLEFVLPKVLETWTDEGFTFGVL